jgi:hypothetical protein
MKRQQVQHEKIESLCIVVWDENTCRRRFWRRHLNALRGLQSLLNSLRSTLDNQQIGSGGPFGLA